MADAYLIFALAVALAVAWVFAVSTLIEPEMQRSHWGGNPDPDAGSTTKSSSPQKVPEPGKNSPVSGLGRPTPAHG